MYFCGIDVAKRKHVALLLDGAGQPIKSAFAFDNNRSGFDQLLAELQALSDPVTIGLEATGHYWLALYETLVSQDLAVVVLNPLQVHAYQRSGLRKCKNDRTDAFWIADFVRIANLPATSRELPVLLQLRELARFRFWLTEQIGDCKRKVLTVLDRVFPEYETLFSSVFLRSSQQLLAQAVTPQEFADFDLDELAHQLQTVSRGRLGRVQAEALQAAARHSVGVSFLADAVHVEMHCLLQQVQLLDTQREQVDQALAELMAQLPQYLTSIPGIGPVTGAAILAEIGDIQRFDNLDKLVGYAGIDATVYQSGQFEAQQAHMSKRGSAYLRHALWLAASMAIQHEPDLKSFYERKRAEGKPHGVALGAVCRKLLARIYVVLKEQRPYTLRSGPSAET
jgi:transposase